MIKKYGKKALFFALALLAAFWLAARGKALPLAPVGAAEKRFYTFLVCGLDKTSENTDVMMLASLDTESGGVNILQIPRDTFVNGAGHGLRVTRVNAVYAAYLGLQGGKKAAMEKLCSFLGRALCVEIDRYVLMDTASFATIVDAVGGVEYDVPFDMDYEDPAQGLYIHLKAGTQMLSGKKAEAFIRYRAGYATGDIGRVEARGGFMREALRQVREKLSCTCAVTIAAELLSAVTTNISAHEAAYFAARLYGAENESVHIKTLAGSAVQNPKTGAWIYYALNKRAALNDINAYIKPHGAEALYEEFDESAVFTDDPKGENPYISKYYYSEIKKE